jgi:hypothetical protein
MVKLRKIAVGVAHRYQCSAPHDTAENIFVLLKNINNFTYVTAAFKGTFIFYALFVVYFTTVFQ